MGKQQHCEAPELRLFDALKFFIIFFFLRRAKMNLKISILVICIISLVAGFPASGYNGIKERNMNEMLLTNLRQADVQASRENVELGREIAKRQKAAPTTVAPRAAGPTYTGEVDPFSCPGCMGFP